jgi:predicted O-methyltransferase YrrM
MPDLKVETLGKWQWRQRLGWNFGAAVPFRQRLIDAIWHGLDPFTGFPEHLYEMDLQGWGERHPYLTDSVSEIRPRVIVEVGVWKGASVAAMAGKLRELQTEGVVVAVDTWLGSSEHWIADHWFRQLSNEQGRPALQKKFMANIAAKGLQDYVVPLPLDSINASHVLRQHNISIDLLHLDGGHDYQSVMADLQAWWPLVRPGGILIGDDYNTNGTWPEVREAFDQFFGRLRLAPFDILPPKCRVRKPAEVRTHEIFEPDSLSTMVRRVTLGAPANGSNDIWRSAEGTRMRRYRWMGQDEVTWTVNVPPAPAARLQAKIPLALEGSPGRAARSAVFIADQKAEVQIRESAIFALSPEMPAGTVTIRLVTSPHEGSDAPTATKRLAVMVMA